jgi:hypothetical protein
MAHVDRALAVVAAALGLASIAMHDADKAPLYFLVAYAFARMR